MSNSKYYGNIFLKWLRAIPKLVIYFWGSDVNSKIQLSRGNLQAADLPWCPSETRDLSMPSFFSSPSKFGKYAVISTSWFIPQSQKLWWEFSYSISEAIRPRANEIATRHVKGLSAEEQGEERRKRRELGDVLIWTLGITAEALEFSLYKQVQVSEV